VLYISLYIVRQQSAYCWTTSQLCFLWPPYGTGQAIIFLFCGFFYLLLISIFSSPNLSRRIGCLQYFHTWCDRTANLWCSSETCFTRLAGNTARKKSPKNRHLGTITQIWRAISSQLSHVSTIEKNSLNNNITSTCPHNMVNFGPLAAEICWRVWGTPANLNGFHLMAALLHGTLVVGVSQTLRRWTEGATYIRQGGYHVGHWPTF